MMERWQPKETLSKGLTFNDITLIPADFSEVRSRKDVDPYHDVLGYCRLGIISSNMDSVWSVELAKEVIRNGGISCMHRFWSIQDNVQAFKDAGSSPYVWGSCGIGKIELDRAIELHKAGVKVIVLDVAHGAALHVVEQFRALKDTLPNCKFVVGNFDNGNQIREFVKRSKIVPDAFKVGIGPGAACTTRITTGVGTPSVTCLQDCVSTGYPIIFDGGIRTPGDLCKALALGAKAVFMGRNFASCLESGAKKKWIIAGREFYSKKDVEDYYLPVDQSGEFLAGYNTLPDPSYASYRGSASKSSYETQGKTNFYRAPEGREFWIPISGSVEDTMNYYRGGVCSSMSYLGSFTIEQYQKNCRILEISESAKIESGPHGDTKWNG